jgi:methyl acetate hydrolase
MRALRFGVYFSRGVLIAILATATVLTLFADRSTKSGSQIDQVLREPVDQKKLPGIVAMVAVADRVTYQGASGKRDTLKNIPMTVDSIFRIASMTKPITSVAVMQLVESRRVKLDEPASTYLPELSQVQVLEEFDATAGKAKLRSPNAPPPSGNSFRTHQVSSTNFSIRRCTPM